MSNFKELKGITETNTHNFCLENKLATDNYGRNRDHYGRNTIKTPSKIPSNISIFVAAQNLLYMEDKHFKIECSVKENTSFN